MRAKTIDLLHFIAKLSPRKIWNYLNIRSSYIISILRGNSFHRGMPTSLSIEPTTSCTLSCPECPSGLKQFTRPQGMMDLKDFKNIIHQLKGSLVYLLLYFQGEPLLNPDFFRMIDHAHRQRIYTATSTNAQQLDDEYAHRIVESGLNRLIISMDGTDQEAYEKYRRGGELEKVGRGVRNVVGWKKKLSSSKPYIIIQFLVMKHNEHQIPEMKKLSRELGADKLELKSAQVYNFAEDTSIIPENVKYARYLRGADGKWVLKKPIRNRCFRMWSGAVISWDGRVVPCCFDKDAAHQLGKLDQQPFKEIWQAESYHNLREQILSDRSSIDICRNCSE